MTYLENNQLRKTTSTVNEHYRLDYVIENVTGRPIHAITATVYHITPASDEAAEEKTRIGCGSVTVGDDRAYFSLEDFSKTPHADRIAIVTRFYVDANDILSE